MRKGQKKRIWTPEQKLEIVKKYLDEHISVRTLGKEYSVEHSMMWRWTKEYISGGKAGLELKKRPGNKFAALHRSKNLSELERLRLVVEKQEIEIARLKKEKLYLDFGLETAEDVSKLLDAYVYYFNNTRPAAALGCKSPVQYKSELGF